MNGENNMKDLILIKSIADKLDFLSNYLLHWQSLKFIASGKIISLQMEFNGDINSMSTYTCTSPDEAVHLAYELNEYLDSFKLAIAKQVERDTNEATAQLYTQNIKKPNVSNTKNQDQENKQ